MPNDLVISCTNVRNKESESGMLKIAVSMCIADKTKAMAAKTKPKPFFEGFTDKPSVKVKPGNAYKT